MKGLLRKDWYQVLGYMKTMYLTVLAVLVIWGMSASDSAVFPLSYTAIFLGILPILLLSYDQASGWTEYGLTLPVSRKTLVAEKYLVGLGCAAMSVLLGAVFALVRVLNGAALEQQLVMMLCGGPCTVLLMNALILPMMYRFGVEKARMMYFLTFVLGGLLGGSTLLEEFPAGMSGYAPGVIVGVLMVALLVLYALSWRLSAAWYGKYRK